MDAKQHTAKRRAPNRKCDYDDIYLINNILYRSVTSPQQIREDTLSMLRQRTENTLAPPRRQSESNIRRSIQNRTVSFKRHHSVGTRDIRMNDVLHLSQIYANPLSLLDQINKSQKSTTGSSYEPSHDMNSHCVHSCSIAHYHIMMDMIGLVFGLVVGLCLILGLLGLGSWLGLGLSLSAVSSALLAILVMQLHKSDDNQRKKHNREQRYVIKPIHPPEFDINGSCNEEFGSSNLDLHLSDTEGCNIIPDLYINGIQDTASSSTNGNDKIFAMGVPLPETQENMFLRLSPIPRTNTKDMPCTNLKAVSCANTKAVPCSNTKAIHCTNTKAESIYTNASKMKYTLNFSEESVALCIFNQEHNSVESGIDVSEEELQITYGRYEITVKEM